MRSERDDQQNRPTMLNRLSRPTNPDAASADTRPGNISWIIGDAWPSTPIPAVTFRQSTAHKSQNCGVRIARSAVQSPGPVARAFVGPGGLQPGGGRRTVSTPNIMNV